MTVSLTDREGNILKAAAPWNVARVEANRNHAYTTFGLDLP
jgi:hypothetical protein